jgi:hypothetical protein
MAFKRRETTIEAIDLNTISAPDAEKRIIEGVKKYATNEGNWAKADANTPYLGSISGMGIESSNLADITMSIERQFLTKRTKRVPVSEGSTDFTLEEGELGKLRILDGQDALAATPGLSIKMLMDLGHMPKDSGYLSSVVAFADIATIGDGHKLNDALKKTIARTEKLSGAEREDALANLKSLIGQGKAYLDLTGNAPALAASRKKIYDADKLTNDTLNGELGVLNEKLKSATASSDSARVAALQSELSELKTRLRLSGAKLRVSSESVAAGEQRSPAAEAKYQQLRASLSETLAQAEKLS